MNAIDIIAEKVPQGKNPIVAPIKSTVQSAQLPKGARNSVAALVQQEQAKYSRMNPTQQRAYNARIKKGKSGGTRKRNHTYKKQ